MKTQMTNSASVMDKSQVTYKLWQKALPITSFLISVLTLNTASAFAYSQDFRLHNRTGSTMLSFQVAVPIPGTPWSGNILSRSLSSGYYTWIDFSEDVELCVFDIRATFRDGTTYTDRVNLCTITDYTIYR